MDEAIVRVVARDDTGLWVEFSPRAGCGRCAEPNGCGGGVGGLAGGKRRVRLPGAPGFDVGDTLRIVAPEASLRRAALRAYGLPLVGALVGAIAARTLFAAEVAPVAGAIAGLAGGFTLLRGARVGGPAWRIERVAPGTMPAPLPACPRD